MEEKNFFASKIAVIYGKTPKAIKIYQQLNKAFDLYTPSEADLIIVIGGDGSLLHALHQYMYLSKPFYGINAGSVGFLMNDIPMINNQIDIPHFIKNLSSAKSTSLYHLDMEAEDVKGNIHHAIAINEVSIFRHTNQAAKFRIEIDGIERMSELSADGALVSTPAGSSAYNLSAGGRIVPLASNVLCLTPISPFRPRRWHGALLPFNAVIKFDILEYNKRPVNAVADFNEFENIKSVQIKSSSTDPIKLMFDEDHTFEDRVIKEQFTS